MTLCPEVTINAFKANWKFHSEHSGDFSEYDT